MIRPFKITYKTSKQHGLRHSILDHRGECISKERKLGNQFFDKLLSYPITAFGYDIIQVQSTTWAKALGDPTSNPKFDRHDVIRALDFWIEYFVYQNKCDYILENTVDEAFELTVRELIETREAVLKCPADTQFVRNKIRVKSTIIDKKYDKMVEFTENVLDSSNSSTASPIDQFCYKVVKMTYKEYLIRRKGILHLPNATQEDINNLMENFRDRPRLGNILRPNVGTLTNETINTGENTIFDADFPASVPDQSIVGFSTYIDPITGIMGIDTGFRSSTATNTRRENIYENMFLDLAYTTVYEGTAMTNLRFRGPNETSITMTVLPQNDLYYLVNHIRSCTIEILTDHIVMVNGVSYTIIGVVDVKWRRGV